MEGCQVAWGKTQKSQQVDQVGTSPVLPTVAAQSWTKAAFIISTRTEDDNWAGRHESFRLLTTMNIKRHSIIRKLPITYLNQVITGLSRPYPITLAHPDESHRKNYSRFGETSGLRTKP